MSQRLLLISPIRNEAAHLELIAGAVAAQTRRPDLWVVVDDNSTDRTPEILADLAERLDFLKVVNAAEAAAAAPPPPPANVKDRLATAAAPRTFNLGLNSVEWESFTHIAKLDGDTELPPDYFERLLAAFDADPELGLAGGVYADPDPDGAGDGWRVVPMPNDYHVAGTLKCYSLPCFEAIGGVHERLGWDTIDETYARMHGYRTRAFADLVTHHHRPWGSADGTLRGRARHGQCAYIVQFPLFWVTLRAFKLARTRPRGLSGLAFLYGYVRSAFLRVPRVEDPAFRRFVRRELRGRARSQLVRGLRRRQKPVPAAVRPAQAAGCKQHIR
ncbi:MAG TPA: glycosyltransferase [Solirubrobacteraceae bacterium]|nr:glycosyltransferase [Solirubrobacteraceae bacterium]